MLITYSKRGELAIEYSHALEALDRLKNLHQLYDACVKRRELVAILSDALGARHRHLLRCLGDGVEREAGVGLRLKLEPTRHDARDQLARGRHALLQTAMRKLDGLVANLVELLGVVLVDGIDERRCDANTGGDHRHSARGLDRNRVRLDRRLLGKVQILEASEPMQQAHDRIHHPTDPPLHQ